jgi:hypothetical protein
MRETMFSDALDWLGEREGSSVYIEVGRSDPTLDMPTSIRSRIGKVRLEEDAGHEDRGIAVVPAGDGNPRPHLPGSGACLRYPGPERCAQDLVHEDSLHVGAADSRVAPRGLAQSAQRGHPQQMERFGSDGDVLFGGAEDWQTASGFVPMIRAEYRLRNLRRIAGPIIGLNAALMAHLEDERGGYLASLDTDEDASVYRYEAREAADEELGWAKEETTILLVGTLVAYGLSLLESALADVAADRTPQGQPDPRVGHPKLEGWLRVLTGLGVGVHWDDLMQDLRSWRSVRNSYAHELHLGDGPAPAVEVEHWDIEGFIDLVRRALSRLDRALLDDG